jgi:glutamate-1-semialdehyde 2,1-aminomutase
MGTMFERLEGQFRERFAACGEHYDRARRSLAGGVSTDLRYAHPFPLTVTHAAGSHKWTVEGHELIDYWMGHGALLFGHAHPSVVESMTRQLSRGTHHAALSTAEVEWAELIRSLLPSAERVRFTTTGSEAVHLALRLARAATGKDRIAKLIGHYHGWHDTSGYGLGTADVHGIPKAVVEQMVAVPMNDPRALEAALDAHDDVAAVILEPLGARSGKAETNADYLRAVREITQRRGVFLIFDEVISAFRCARGGIQELYGIQPDLTTLGKIVSGGVPGGAAVAGRADILDQVSIPKDSRGFPEKRVSHLGTFNGNPLCAAAGIATLTLCADPELYLELDRRGRRLREALNALFARRKQAGRAYGLGSVVHVFLGDWPVAGDLPRSRAEVEPLLLGNRERNAAWRMALLLNGVDFPAQCGVISTAHTDEDFERTVEAFDRALGMIAEG